MIAARPPSAVRRNAHPPPGPFPPSPQKQVMKKMIAASRGEFGEEEKKAQKDINLGNDVDKAVRCDR